MTSPLAEPIAAYFAAEHAHDLAATVASFGENAVVKDEGRHYHGREAIRTWLIKAMSRSAYTIVPGAAVYEDDEARVEASVSGAFAGSPISLTYTFTLADGAISRLEIS